MTTKTALIIGITGQAGSYLAELLIGKGYIVHGIKRRSSSFNTARIDHLYSDRHNDPDNQKLILHYGDITDPIGLSHIIAKHRPDEIYNLAAQSHVQLSFHEPVYTCDVTDLGVIKLLETIRSLGLAKKVKYLQASSSEMYGKVLETPQRETTPFNPQSPYAIAKAAAYHYTKLYREAYGMFACNAICFNMESPRRGETFVTRKITMAAARIALKKQEVLYLGNLNAKRDWGHCRDYVRAMWLMMQAEHPDDFVISTGRTVSIRGFAELAFKEALPSIFPSLYWKGEIGKPESEVGMIDGRAVIKIDPRYYRPAEVDLLCGNSEKARNVLHWGPVYKLEHIVREMVASDLSLAGKTI